MPIPDISPRPIGDKAEASALSLTPGTPPVGRLIHIFDNNLRRMRAPKARLRSLAFILDYLLLHCVASALSHWVCVAMLGALLPGKALGAKTLATSAKVIELTYQYGVSLLFPVALLLISFVYFVALTHQSGASLGQALVGLRVVTRAGELPTIEQAAKRFFASIFTLMSAGFFFFLGAATRDGICFHDEASGTRVVLRDSWQEAVEAPESSSGFENKSPSKAA